MKTALIVVDLQNDFMEGGVLAARETLSLINPLNRFVEKLSELGIICVFTRDWHPVDHWSFQTMGGPWPVHGVQNSPGAQIYSGANVPPNAWIVDKGIDSVSLGYSDFGSTHLEDRLHSEGISDLLICGIATEYCVKADALDAIALGFNVSVLTDLIRPIEAQPGDATRAIAEMTRAGAKMLLSDDWQRL